MRAPGAAEFDEAAGSFRVTHLSYQIKDTTIMQLPTDFEKKLTLKTDEQLYDMLAHEEDYLPEALAAARAELQRRELDPARVTQLGRQTEAKLDEESRIANEPLSWPVRILMALLAFGIPQFVAAKAYEVSGYQRKHRECWAWMRYGMGFWLCFWIFSHVLSSLPVYALANPLIFLFVDAVLSVVAVGIVVFMVRRANERSRNTQEYSPH